MAQVLSTPNIGKWFWTYFPGKISLRLPSRPKLLQKNSLKRKCFAAMNFVKNSKESLYKAYFLACFLAKRDTPVAATLQRKSSGVIIFVITTKMITKESVPGRVRVKFAQNGGYEKATKKPRKSNEKGPNTVFLDRRGPRKSHEKVTSKNATSNEKSSEKESVPRNHFVLISATMVHKICFFLNCSQ